MARLPRYIIPGQPQHIIQRGNNRQPIFAAAADDAFFRDVLVEAASKHQLAIHAYAWMTNHIHPTEMGSDTIFVSKISCLTPFQTISLFRSMCRPSARCWKIAVQFAAAYSMQMAIFSVSDAHSRT